MPPAVQAGQRRHAQVEPAVAFRARPLHQFHEQEIHDAGRRIRTMAHQVHRGLLAGVVEQQVGERHQPVVLPYHRQRRAHEVTRIERAEREALLAHLLVGQPRIGDDAQVRQQAGHGFSRKYLQAQTLAMQLVDRVAQHLARLAVQVEVLQPHPRLFADLQQVQAHFQIQVEVGRADLVEHRPATGAFALFEEGPHQLAPCDLVGAHRIAHRDPAAPDRVEHHESLVLIVEQQALVAHQREVCLRRGKLLDQRQRLRQCGLVGSFALQLLRTDQAGRREQHAGDDRGHQRAQRSRRAAVLQAELPPQVGAVIDVLVAEHHQPRRAAQRRHDRHDPAHAEAGAEQRRAPMEQPVGRRQRQCQQGHQRSLFVVDALEQRKHRAGQQQHQGQPVSRIQPPLQAARQDQQQHADHAGQQVRNLQHRQRQQLAQDRHAHRQCAGRAGEQQYRAADQGQAGKERRQQPSEPRRQHGLAAPALRLALQHQQCSGTQRQQVIDHPVRGQRTEDRCSQLRVAGGTEAGQHHRLEHPQPAGHVADQADDLGDHEDRQEMPEAVVQRIRHQHVKHRGGEAPVARPDQDLLQRGAHGRQRHAPTPDAQLAMDQPARQPGQRQCDQHRTHRLAQAGQRQLRRQRHPQQGGAGERQQAQPEAAGAEQHHAGDLAVAQPVLQVEAIADRAGHQQRHAHRIAEGVADEGNQADAAPRQPTPDRGQRQAVVHGHHRVTRQGKQHRQTQAFVRDALHVLAHLVVVHFARQQMQGEQRQAQHAHREQRTGGTAQPRSPLARAIENLARARCPFVLFLHHAARIPPERTPV